MRRKLCISMALCMLLGNASTATSKSEPTSMGTNSLDSTALASNPQSLSIPTIVTITRPDDLKPRTNWIKPVQFLHAMHAAHVPCNVCHHEETNSYLGHDMGTYTPCTDCHNDEGVLEPTSFYAAWHAKSPISCMGCHWHAHLEGNSAPPLSCTRGCHPYPAFIEPIAQSPKAAQSASTELASSTKHKEYMQSKEAAPSHMDWEISPAWAHHEIKDTSTTASLVHAKDLKE